MIQFPCICGRPFSLPDDRAGTQFQCPQCGRLVDVPALNDLAGMTDEGTYRLDDVAVAPDPQALEKMGEAFTRSRTDEMGRDIDLRPTEEELADVGDVETLEMADDPGHAAPKYDPITGERIKPLELKEDPPLPVIPAGEAAAEEIASKARVLVGYADRSTARTFAPHHIPREMFRFTNLVVILAILVWHVVLQAMLFPLMIGFFLIAPAFLIMCGLLLSHYAVVVNDIATEERDELPRPLRNLSFHDDLWGPFVHFALALLVFYGPLIAVKWMPPNAMLLQAYVLTAIVVGTLAFPAALLTTTTSGHWLNLSPDRMLRVIRMIGLPYALLVFLWAAAAVTYVSGIAAAVFVQAAIMSPSGSLERPWWIVPMPFAYPLLLTGILLMHGFCWYLGYQYRDHHRSFGWAFQSHAPRRTHLRRKGFPVGMVESPAQREQRSQRVEPQSQNAGHSLE